MNATAGQTTPTTRRGVSKLHNRKMFGMVKGSNSHARNQAPVEHVAHGAFRMSTVENPRDGWNRPGARPPLATGVNMGNPTPFDIDDIWARIEPKVDKNAPGGCWRWTGTTASGGYGHFKWRPETYRVHRIAYMALVGDIPEELEIDHLCRNRACCNPDHLEAVTGRVNVRRGISPAAQNAVKTHCPQGHAYDDENTGYRTGGGRRCLTCHRSGYRRQEAS